ncbi:MAG TPA: PAS domain S-box protein [Burkholderiaceae bacterium]|nr:PAS domain S-box protein [Burkholderiaceae bacterium]
MPPALHHTNEPAQAHSTCYAGKWRLMGVKRRICLRLHLQHAPSRPRAFALQKSGSTVPRPENAVESRMSPTAERLPAGRTLQQSEDRFKLLVEGVKDYAIFMLDANGFVASWNRGAESIKGYSPDEIIGKHFSLFYPPETLASGLPAHELEVAKEVGSFEDEGWRVRKDGSLFWANVVITALHDPRGNLLGFSKVTRDLTQRRAHEEALRQSEERFRLLVEGVKDYAIFMLDANGFVISWNSGAERINGYSADEIIGKHFSLFYPAEARESGWPEHELQTAAERGSFIDEGWRLRKDGTRIWAHVTITALRDDEGRLLSYAKLTRDLTDRKKAEALEVSGQERDEILEAERSARMAAQRATRIKDEFLATLSHELRTPLNAIVGWTQILRRAGSSVKPADLARGLDVIDRNARAQVQLIDDLLDLSRVITGKVRLDLQQVSIVEVVQRTMHSVEPAAAAKGIRLKTILDPAPATISADSSRLQQILWNLLSNAIKFTPKGGQVQVLLQRVNSHIELSVSDTGIGISPEFLPHVFERFTQRDSSASRSFGGLGLGLAICKQLVELHGGTIRASSQGPGLGATFLVELPLALLHVGRQDSERLHPTQSIPDSEVLALPKLAGVHIFIVDDEPDARDLLQRVFEEQSAKVTIFTNANDALNALKVAKPHVIVCDIGMPGMDGYQFMRAMRAGEAKAQRIPALALTAFARAEDRKRSLLAGYQAHLAKPFDVAELMLVVADLVGR